MSDTDLDTDYLAEVLEKTRRKLLDTTLRTRLLKFREVARDIPVVDEMPDQVFQDLVLNHKSFTFDPIPEGDNEDETNFDHNRALPVSLKAGEPIADRYLDDRLQTPFTRKELDRRLKRLYSEHRTVVEESGANSLFLAVGFLEWLDSSEQTSRQKSPLMLLPVRLEREGSAGAAVYRLHFDDEALDTNYSLVEKLKSNFEIQLPTVEDEELPEEYWEKVDQAIHTKHREGWNVIREMALGLFSFNKQIMWHDLDPSRWPSHSQLFDKSVLTRVLLGPKPGEPAPGQRTAEHSPDEPQGEGPKITLIRDADSSQYSALVDALTVEGGIVIEGPPGTGKSQTISNLIATALGQGKSILFVAEKMAALEVVYKRLEEAGLGEFCLQLHGLKSSKKELLASIKDRMGLNFPNPRDLANRMAQLEQTKEELVDYSKALNEPVGPERIELHRLPWKLELLRRELPGSFDALRVGDAGDMNLQAYQWARGRLEDLGAEWEAISEPARVSWKGYLPDSADEKDLDEIAQCTSSLAHRIEEFLAWIETHGMEDAVPSISLLHRVLNLGSQKAEEILPDLPGDVPDGLVHRIVHGNLLSSADSILLLVEQLAGVASKVNELFDYASEEAQRYASTIEKHSAALSNVAVSRETLIADLPNEAARFVAVLNKIDELPETAKPVLRFHEGFARRLEDYERVIATATRMLEGPGELSLHATPTHTRKAAETYFANAKETFEALALEADALGSFLVTEAKDTQAIVDALRVLRANAKNFFRTFKSEYRAAKNLTKSLLRDRSQFSVKDQFLAELAALSEFCSRRDTFQADADFGTALGSLFNGMETNWSALEQVISFSRKFKETWGPEIANEVLADWDAHCEQMELARSGLQSRMDEINEFKRDHPFPEAMWQRPIAEVRASLAPASQKIADAERALCQPWCASMVSLGSCRDILEAYSRGKKLGVYGFNG